MGSNQNVTSRSWCLGPSVNLLDEFSVGKVSAISIVKNCGYFFSCKWRIQALCRGRGIFPADFSCHLCLPQLRGDVFTGVRDSVHREGVSVPACITGHMTRGVSVQGVSVHGESLLGGPSHRTVRNARYASYWNAFLFFFDRSQRPMHAPPPPPAPRLVQILSFSCNIQQRHCKIIGWRAHFGSWRLSLPRGNPGSATGYCLPSVGSP